MDVEREERVRERLAQARVQIEQDIAAATDPTLRRIAADAATIAALSIVKELLSEEIQAQVEAIITLHDRAWQMDTIPEGGTTPRKPLNERLFDKLLFFARAPEHRKQYVARSSPLVRP